MHEPLLSQADDAFELHPVCQGDVTDNAASQGQDWKTLV